MPHRKESTPNTEVLKSQLTILFPYFIELADVSTNYKKEVVPYIVLDAIIQYCINPYKSTQQREIEESIKDTILNTFKKYLTKENIEPRKLGIIETLITNLDITPDPEIGLREVNPQSFEVFDYIYNKGWDSQHVAEKLNIILSLVEYRYAVAINYLLHLLTGLNEIKGRSNVRTIEYVPLQQIG